MTNPTEREALREWALKVRDEILYPLSQGSGKMAVLADGFGQTLLLALAAPAPREQEPKEKPRIVSMHRDDYEYVCPQCSQSFPTISACMSHIESHKK